MVTEEVVVKTQNRKAKLTKRAVDDATPTTGRFILWDSMLPGFGLRVEPSGLKTFLIRYRPRSIYPAPKRFMTIGRFGSVTADQARRQAMTILGTVAKGQDPAAAIGDRRKAITLEEAATRFLAEHVAPKRKPNTFVAYRNAFAGHIIPILGKRSLAELTRAEIAKMHSSMARSPAVANYAVAALSSLFTWAERRGLIPEGVNPARRVEKFRENQRERFLTADELRRLGNALREAETIGLPWAVNESKATAKHAAKPDKRLTVMSPFAAAAIRLLLLTGCRLREVLDLRWEHIDFDRGCLFLPDSKTGRKTVLLGKPALEIIERLPRVGLYVVAGPNADKPLAGLKRPWAAVKRYAGLDGVRIHDLRHSYASIAAAAGMGLPIIGRLLGHRQPATTARYAHLADDPLRRAAEAISRQIAAHTGDLDLRRPGAEAAD